MITFKARMFNFLLRNRHIMSGRLVKEKYDLNTSIQGFRDQCEKGAARFGKIPENISVKPDRIAGLYAEWIIPLNSDPAKVIMYVHGGGYVSGSCSDHRNIISKFALRTGYVNLLYEYRLAPEFPFPAAINDSLAVYEHLLELGFLPQNILIAGESAGGGLTLATLLAIKDKGHPLPVAAVSISPWTDLTCSGESYRTKNKYSLAPLDSWHVFSTHYIGNADADHPYISPLFGDLKGLPPILINSGTDDELYDDGESFYRKALQSGVNITFRRGESMVHCYPLLSPFFKEATQAMDEIAEFIKRHLN